MEKRRPRSIASHNHNRNNAEKSLIIISYCPQKTEYTDIYIGYEPTTNPNPKRTKSPIPSITLKKLLKTQKLYT